MEVMKEETFGPILPVQIVKSDEEALTLMNDSDYGLTAAIFTSSMDRYNALAPHVQTGISFFKILIVPLLLSLFSNLRNHFPESC